MWKKCKVLVWLNKYILIICIVGKRIRGVCCGKGSRNWAWYVFERISCSKELHAEYSMKLEFLKKVNILAILLLFLGSAQIYILLLGRLEGRLEGLISLIPCGQTLTSASIILVAWIWEVKSLGQGCLRKHQVRSLVLVQVGLEGCRMFIFSALLYDVMRQEQGVYFMMMEISYWSLQHLIR